MINITIDNQWL